MAEVKKAWKIFSLEKGKLKFLFHGLNGSRTVPQGTWLVANRKKNARDGRGRLRYTAGFHAFLSREEAYRWEWRFKKTRLLVRVLVSGMREKPSQRGSDMKLFDRLYVPKSTLWSFYGNRQP